MDYEKIKKALDSDVTVDQLTQEGASAAEIAAAKAEAAVDYAALTPTEKAYFDDIKNNRDELVLQIPAFVNFFDKPKKIKEQRIFLRGYLGRAYKFLDENPQRFNALRMRMYLSPELDSYVEFNVDDLLLVIHPTAGGLENGGCIIWLRAKCPKKNTNGDPINGTETDIDLTYGGHGYELSQTKHYIDGDMLAGYDGGITLIGCQGGQGLTPTCPGKGCQGQGQTPTCPGKGCQGQGQTPTCPGKGCQGGGMLPTGMLCDKYTTVVACDEWDFRNKYNPYRP